MSVTWMDTVPLPSILSEWHVPSAKVRLKVLGSNVLSQLVKALSSRKIEAEAPESTRIPSFNLTRTAVSLTLSSRSVLMTGSPRLFPLLVLYCYLPFPYGQLIAACSGVLVLHFVHLGSQHTSAVCFPSLPHRPHEVLALLD